ncbi:unnamed protein product [Brassica oleracea var. botrytis]
MEWTFQSRTNTKPDQDRSISVIRMSKKIITSILKSEAAHSAVHEDAWDITVEEEPKLEG